MMEMMEKLFAQPNNLEENINELLRFEGDRVGDEVVFYPDLTPEKWAEAMRLIKE